MKLFNFSMIFPARVAFVERLFSKLETIKNRLRNQLSQLNLESLLTIATESPKQSVSKSTFKR